MEDKSERYLKKIKLKNRQREIDKQYAREGLTNEVLDKQVEINMLRHAWSIPDENNFIFELFVQ